MYRLILTFVVCITFFLGVDAQQKVSGTVTDKSGFGIPGVNVVEKGTLNGISTDIDGNFTLTVANDAILKFTAVGMKTVSFKYSEAEFGGRLPDIQMVEDASLLDEVVVVGYGTQKKENLTGAVSSIDVKDAVVSRPVVDVAKALQGLTPGLTITNKIGGVGTESTIKLRGAVGSLSASGGTSPLILVDGVEIPSLTLLNPSDIESISVLKDAASASIYGTRATWGVILVKTKSGEQGAPRVSYSNNFAWNTPTRMPELMSTVDNAEYILKVLRRDKPNTNSFSLLGFGVDALAIENMRKWEKEYGGMSQRELGEMKEGRDFEIRDGKSFFYRSFDPREMFTKKWTPQQSHDFSISGGSKYTTYNIGLGYLKQEGIMKINTDKYERYNLTANTTTKIKDWWKVRANLLFTRTNDSEPYKYTAGRFDTWYYLTRWPRWYPYTTYQGKDFRSAVTDIKQANRQTKNTNYIRVNLGTELMPIKNLSVNFDYTFGMWNQYFKRNGGQVYAYDMFRSNPFNNFRGIYSAVDNRAVQTSRYTVSNIFKAYATYNLSIKEKHNFKFIAGVDAEKRSRLGHYSERRQLIDINMPEISLATGDQYVDRVSYNRAFASAGAFGRINYDYLQKYLFEVNLRYDGSSRFPMGKKWALFPSASAGWRVSEEAFMNWIKPIVSDLKLRASWGSVGNQDVADNSFISTMASGKSGWSINGEDKLYLKSPSVMSPLLTWEKVTTYDIGVDASFFNNKLALTFDWYQRVTSGMHTAGEALPATFGAAAPKINYGELTGTGFELGASYRHRFENGFYINVTASLADVKEVITKYNDQNKNIYRNYKGRVLGEIWGYETDRLFQESDFNADGTLKDGIASQSRFESGNFKYGPGDVKYKDLNGDGVINFGKNTIDDYGDLKVIGNSLPKMEYNFGVDLAYKNFDLRAFFQGVGSRDYWAVGSIGIPSGMSTSEGVFKHQSNYWTPENPNAFYPRPTNHAWVSHGRNFLRQTRYLQNMAYLRLKNLTVGYTLPKSLMQKISFTSARIYLSGENLFEFDNMTIPIDPETTAYKTGYGSYSRTFGRTYPFHRTFSVGLQVQF